RASNRDQEPDRVRVRQRRDQRDWNPCLRSWFGQMSCAFALLETPRYSSTKRGANGQIRQKSREAMDSCGGQRVEKTGEREHSNAGDQSEDGSPRGRS